MNAYLLIFIIINADGGGSSYVADSGLSWLECEVSGTVAESFAPETIWYCEPQGDFVAPSIVNYGSAR